MSSVEERLAALEANYGFVRSGIGSGFKRPTINVTWPFPFDPANPHRIVAGAGTPPELVSYGILEAILFYITDKSSHLEYGYFFVGQSNSMDGGADDKALVMGQTLYPTPGDPTSPTMSDVRTNLQFDLYGSANPGIAYTIFKDAVIQMNATVGQLLSSVPNWYLTDNKINFIRTNTTDEAIGIGKVGDTIERLEVLTSGEIQWGPGGSTSRDTNLYRSSANLLKTDDSLEVAGDINYQSSKISLKNADYAPQNPGSGTTTSGSYADLPNSPAATISKAFAGTRLRVTAFLETFSTLANTSVDLAVKIGSTDYTVWHHVHNPANVHDLYGGVIYISGVGSGSTTVTGRWRRPAGGGTITMNGDDYFCLSVEEVT